jgi:O-antigen/teichoic acid export membrane protein
MSQLKKGAVLSYVNIVLTNMVGLFITPFIIRNLGNSDYGLYALIGSLIAYLSLMDLGLNNTIVRFVSKYRAESDKKAEQQFLGTIMVIYFFISFIILCIGTVLYFNIETIFGKSLLPSQMADAKIMFLILLLNIAIDIPGGSFLAICTAYQQYVFPKVLTIVRYLLRTVTVFAVLNLGGKSISLVIIDTVFTFGVILITFYYCIKKLGVRFSFMERSKGVYKEIFSYSVWIFISALIMSFQWNAGQLILGMHVNTIVVAVFSVGLMLGGYFGAFAGVINTMLLPKAAQMLADKQDSDEISNTMIAVGRINACISFFILSAFVLLGQEFINLWVGTSYKESWLIAVLIMLATIIPMTQSFGNSVLEVKNKVKYKSIGMFFSMFTAIVFSYFFGKQYGIYGVLVPIVIGMFVNTIINNVMFVKFFDFNIMKFYKKTFLYQTLYTLVFLSVFVFFKKYFVIDSWFKFVSFAIIYSLLFLSFYIGLLFNKEEKSLLWRK